ncbi:toluene-4-monooxygenase system B family protein [Nocardia donostiensis]|uniref:Toluene monooxygenase n=1 Tax=Nocardia donostiensis TaxID=1538463 RepID=A0A1W0B9X6_9NOCA|nr:toluene-4-monooxygenase system B family protein [Nocardia donostiensis]ONM46692.1 toluene monooxygenase [Nocardia donostiensis]OQS12773.1 toluene monooxygenase [Nocardia donostiensis]OQS19315.1 toluene monooxygenase [Nocardia donostiensis]
MAPFPISSKFHGDFVLKLVAVDTDNTIDEVAAAAAEHSVGIHVPDQPGKVIRARAQDADAPFPRDMKLSDTGLEPTDTIEFYFSEV